MARILKETQSGDMEAFDQLPPDVRAVLREVSVPVGAQQALEALSFMTPGQVVAKVRQLDMEMRMRHKHHNANGWPEPPPNVWVGNNFGTI